MLRRHGNNLVCQVDGEVGRVTLSCKSAREVVGRCGHVRTIKAKDSDDVPSLPMALQRTKWQ
eukprot:11235791-Prorocentrum_lima.AAC.1